MTVVVVDDDVVDVIRLDNCLTPLTSHIFCEGFLEFGGIFLVTLQVTLKFPMGT